MQDKLIEILSSATGWMTAGDVAEKGGYRSAANVGLGLKNLGDRVESRKSKDRKNISTGHPLVEWKLVEKEFSEAERATNGSSKKKPAGANGKAREESEGPTDKECCNAAKVMATTASAELETMRQLVEAKQGRIYELEAFQRRLFLQLEFVPGDDIEHRVAQVMHERIHGQQKIADLEDDVRRHNDRLQEVSATIVRFLVVVHQLSGNAHKPVNLHEAEQQIATTFETMRSRVEELEATIHAMELDEEQSKEVTDVAVGYLVKAPKRRPRVITSPDRAREAALSAARQHGRGEVLALVPVGKAIRGAEWKEAA